jgi:transposase-like protein
MVTETTLCPYCQQAEPVVRHGTNRGGTARRRCRDCNKTFTPKPNPRVTTPETKQHILKAMEERLSQRAIARMLSVSRNTIKQVAQKKPHSCPC